MQKAFDGLHEIALSVDLNGVADQVGEIIGLTVQLYTGHPLAGSLIPLSVLKPRHRPVLCGKPHSITPMSDSES